MESLEEMAMNKYRKPRIFSVRKVCYKLSSLLMMNAEKWGAKLREVGGDASLLSLNFICC